MLRLLRAAPLEQPWSNLIGKYSIFVAKHPWPFIIFPTLLTIFLSGGIFWNFKIVRGVDYLYAPLNAPWKVEETTFGENWASDDDHFYPGKDLLRRQAIYLILESKDKGNVLREEYTKEFIQILDWMANKTFVSSNGTEFSYRNVCLHFQNDCFKNNHAKLIAEIYSKNHSNSLFNITYPIYRSTYATEPIDISKVLGNVTTNKDGFVVSASAWLLLYQLKTQNRNSLSLEFAKNVAESIETNNAPTKLLNLFYFHSDTFNEELEKENRRLTPKFSITFSVLIIFAICSTFTFKNIDRLIIIDWVLSKPILGIAGVICTLFAIISSTGLLMWFNVTFVDMCTVMPFLSLTIGIDDTFLMLAAWHETDRSLPVEKRIELSMKHAAVSVSITSLTDALAFLIGSIAPLPAVIYFCYYSSAAILFIFFYCLTMFIAILALQGRREQEFRHSITGKLTIPFDDENRSIKNLIWRMGSQISIKDEKKEEEENNNNIKDLEKNKEAAEKPEEDVRMWYQKFFEDIYAPFISKPTSMLVSLLIYFAYLAGAFYGIQQLKIGFDLINIVQENSVSRTFLEIRNKVFPEDTKVMDIAVMNSPNFSLPQDRQKFLRALNDFETTWCSEGRNSTEFWFFEMQNYIKNLGFGADLHKILDNPVKLGQSKKTFLMSNEKYSYDVLSDHQFRLSTRLKMVTSDEEIAKCAKTMRDLCQNHSELNMTTYSPLWNIADEYEIMWPQTMQDVYISIAVMVPVSLLFIPQPICSIIIGFNIASIAFGVIGFMSFLGVSLDATSMITVAMSVGFSVDFAAHVSYAYMTISPSKSAKKSELVNRLHRTLGSVGWPVTQASLSVLLGVSSLYLVDSYVVQTCFRTVLLVILFGTTHALVFLPLLLFNIHRVYANFYKFLI